MAERYKKKIKYKKGTEWNKPLTVEMIEYQKTTGKNAVYNGMIMGQFEYWLYWRRGATRSIKNALENVKILKEWGQEIFSRPPGLVEFLNKDKFKEINSFLGDIKNQPHAFVLACIMDRVIKTERAFPVPYLVSKIINGFKMSKLLEYNLEQYIDMFGSNNLHYYNKVMATNFYKAVQKIHTDYQNDASQIWANNPSSAAVVRRFLLFDGVGPKIGTMAANILARDFKIPMSDYYSIDISVDRQVRKVFQRLGFIKKGSNDYNIIYFAREHNPDYPGIFDNPCWLIGKNWCKQRNPKCDECRMTETCPKLI